MAGAIELRAVRDDDVGIFFEHMQDADAVRMAGFVSKEWRSRPAHDAHWAKIRANPGITIRTIVSGGGVAGHVASFVMMGDLELTYWIARDLWGRGVATEALRQFLDVVRERPIHGRAAKDNGGSIRVLEKCGFRRVGEDRGFAHGRGEEIEEVVLRLG